MASSSAAITDRRHVARGGASKKNKASRQHKGGHDHITALAQNPTKPAEEGPRFKLTINAKNYTHKVQSIEVDYSGDGQSSMSFTVDGVLEGLGDSKVSLKAGYGNHMVEYFSGRLEEPDDDEYTAWGNALAYGPFKQLGTQYFGEWVDYSNKNVGEVIHDIAKRAGYLDGTIKVLKPDSFTFPTLTFNEESSLLEAVQKVIGDAGYIFVDRPGHQREAKPKPLPRVGQPNKATYKEKHYEVGSFTTKPIPVAYYKVVVFHRQTATSTTSTNTNQTAGSTGATSPAGTSGAGTGTGGTGTGGTGTTSTTGSGAGSAPATSGSTSTAPKGPQAPVDDIHAEARVRTKGKKKPPKSRIFFIPDFIGTQAEAQKVAHLMAERLSKGLYSFELKAALNPALLIYDAIKVERVKAKGSKYYEQTFECIIDAALKGSIKEKDFSMDLTGTAILLKEKKLKEKPPTTSAIAVNPALATLPDGQPWGDAGDLVFWLDQSTADFSALP